MRIISWTESVRKVSFCSHDNTTGTADEIRHGVARVILLGAVAVPAHTLQVPFSISTASALGNDMIDIHITAPQFPTTSNTGIPAMITRVVAKISITIICHLLHLFRTWKRTGSFVPYKHILSQNEIKVNAGVQHLYNGYKEAAHVSKSNQRTERRP